MTEPDPSPQDGAGLPVPPCRVAIAEDDRDISSLVTAFLTARGVEVHHAANARQLDRLLAVQHVDVLLLDIMLPGEDGISICRRLRSAPETAELPVLIVSALGSEVDRVKGLEIGADDYLVKPFSPHELLARIRAVLRRTDSVQRRLAASRPVMEFDGWRLDLRRHALHAPDGTRVPLTSGELRLLSVFARNCQRTLSRDHLMVELHGRKSTPLDRSVDILVSRLRRKIEPDARAPLLIRTVRNGGYIFTPEVQLAPEPA
jgi:two-component system OmpR family response regulator